jgi:hypothetical protein
MRRVMGPMRMRLTVATVAVGLAVIGAGCGSVIPIEQVAPQGCPAALLEGTLARNERSGLGVHQADVDVTSPVEWPAGWSIVEGDGVRGLADGGGRVIGREGDWFSAGGGFTSGPVEVFQPCGGIEITPAGD